VDEQIGWWVIIKEKELDPALANKPNRYCARIKGNLISDWLEH
jgi:hypothetical protein